ncbi:hypothetical protein NM688_g4881 [Phlebia brevispora]|uniref:Uncharacterized protein n=1 Tax=Phlebia brevispora TaxID=194682 RepID=A0ACC1T1W1_9APHY|nr:hypothetical protein NM688_g4881 [Phlebia brevispora]
MAAYSTDSAGMHPSHTLPLKLQAIAATGFSQVELAFPDLEAFTAQQFPGYKVLDHMGNGGLEELCQAAQQIRMLCDELALQILVIHPFSNFEGYTDAKKKAQGLQRAAAWFKVMKVLGCTMLQVGSNDDPFTTDNLDEITSDLRTLADEAAAQDPPIRIAYEMWAWGAYVNTWEDTWEVCKRVDRPNFGLCLDTFQICARAYVDPANPTAPLSPSATSKLQESLRNLADANLTSKIFYLQLSDGSNKPDLQDLHQEAHKQGIDVLYAWSNAWRPLPFMDRIEARDSDAKGYGGFLPVMDVIRAVLQTGWKGPWSYEVFYSSEMLKEEVDIPKKWTEAAQSCHKMILDQLQSRS